MGIDHRIYPNHNRTTGCPNERITCMDDEKSLCYYNHLNGCFLWSLIKLKFKICKSYANLDKSNQNNKSKKTNKT